MYTFLLVIFILVVLLLIPLILMQTGSGAQSGMFGSDFAMGVFGAKTNEVLIKITKWLVGIFFFLAFLLGYIKVREFKFYERARAAERLKETKEQSQSAETQSSASAEVDTNLNLPLPQK
ncbi:MAG: preprotein translocase subunit SecG [Brevinematia bacterium]